MQWAEGSEVFGIEPQRPSFSSFSHSFVRLLMLSGSAGMDLGE